MVGFNAVVVKNLVSLYKVLHWSIGSIYCSLCNALWFYYPISEKLLTLRTCQSYVCRQFRKEKIQRYCWIILLMRHFGATNENVSCVVLTLTIYYRAHLWPKKIQRQLDRK